MTFLIFLVQEPYIFTFPNQDLEFCRFYPAYTPTRVSLLYIHLKLIDVSSSRCLYKFNTLERKSGNECILETSTSRFDRAKLKIARTVNKSIVINILPCLQVT